MVNETGNNTTAKMVREKRMQNVWKGYSEQIEIFIHQPIAEVKLTVCKQCAIREYYGTSGSNSKLYKKHMSNKKLFGVDSNE